MSEAHAHWRAYLALLVILILIAGFFAAMSYMFGFGAVTQNTSDLTAYVPPPPPTAQDAVSAQQSFQYLVVYTANGFKPASLTMDSGETVRFSNVTPIPIVIQSAAAQSPSLPQGEYWQYTASSTGTFTFVAGNSSIVITVQ